MAQIAAEVRKSIVKDPKKITTESCLIKFQTKKPETIKNISEEREKRIANSKAFWGANVGVSKVNASRRIAKNKFHGFRHVPGKKSADKRSIPPSRQRPKGKGGQ